MYQSWKGHANVEQAMCGEPGSVEIQLRVSGYHLQTNRSGVFVLWKVMGAWDHWLWTLVVQDESPDAIIKVSHDIIEIGANHRSCYSRSSFHLS